ncbi:MAG: 2-oxoacid:acceptor oxidoreductase subunit alpha [Bacteroidales bacterium]|uniref:2-oxoacid:acceptor oxidoreductase subunit alpha n=1 Tax=Candidatus Cryptobacteroides sp. TaxID=2952915 RepID=UPI002A74DF13|nr:2-oxoacid:acceptor oxidoreductase subunit alpha [Candidatus Cryptobacteroides sp.]MDD5915182.1 2-oxoacid:acceptor oxidoreductase subunit alpha [Bacteroidales bacterium]MDD7234875.1 2-oxoacid:acceptor oxidoreductase subunit alpha [Bacteroidales bacterium]MDD7623937.1 2-oxoacid:acceptor oxidoreductase subunit alpha [Bacteroidales bacterium]MDY2702199.1 2-oxoacid:acceptor oxidoreductase subunit alpha [Candidatus Cryptobacteroides sp.]
MQHKVIDTNDVVIRFAGDSGDGMQLTGSLFADMSAIYGNELSTFPDYPAEIRAPHGTVSGVSGFQVHIGSKDVNTPGDYCDLLVAMNPAALKANAKWCKHTAMILVDVDAFGETEMKKAGFLTDNPFAELHVEDRALIAAPITSMTKESLKDSGMDLKSILKCKNMFTLGMACFIYSRPLEYIYSYIEKKFAKKHPEFIEPNRKVLNDGFNYAANIQAIPDTYTVEPAKLKKGLYRNMTGNQAIAWGLLAASEKSHLPLFCGSYPITPATAILEELAIHKSLGAKTLQAEDEIAGICTAIGASFAGNLAVTTTSGPGLSLKSEAMGLAVMAELPLVIVDVQRGGPSTGLPTKTEQTDLLQALYGRNGECPVVVMAAKSPAGCFDAAFYAAKIALEHMTPVILLSEGFIGNGSEPWLIPSMSQYPEIKPPFASGLHLGDKFKPYERDPETLVRKWAVPGMKGYEHRVGGLEKNHDGVLSNDPENHAAMVAEREEKIRRISKYIPELKVEGPASGKLLIVGWGGTFGHLLTAYHTLVQEGREVSFAHFEYIKPLPRNTEAVFAGFEKIIVCELNSGMFCAYLRGLFPDKDFRQYNKVQGQPFLVSELVEAIRKEL